MSYNQYIDDKLTKSAEALDSIHSIKLSKIIAFNDIKESVQEDIKEFAFSTIADNYIDTLREMFGDDPYDMGKPNTDLIAEALTGAIDRACDKWWSELVLEVKL